ncbi:MAG: Gfo/Idh/MocA family oxidoreductase [Bacteroidia bacterium]|nr:Gfo/Idh/MocA family oxidoreductase [Bacteroidia bacterium]
MRIGLVGIGYLGKIHLKLIKEIIQEGGCSELGIFDVNVTELNKVSEEWGIKKFSSLDELIQESDIVDIVTPGETHFEIAKQCIISKKHVFIEKPVTKTVNEAIQLKHLAEENNVLIQVGHVERFNPAFLSAKEHIHSPLFIEVHRLAMYNPRGTDVSVTLDLMIHDLDLILNINPYKVKNIHANGVEIVSHITDIANVRLEFENGSVANITTSRLSLKNMRKFRVFQKNAYISIDLLEKKSEVVHIKDVDEQTPEDALIFSTGNSEKEIVIEKPKIVPTNAIKEELKSFLNSIKKQSTPMVSIDDAIRVMELAYQIEDKIHQSKMYFNKNS